MQLTASRNLCQLYFIANEGTRMFFALIFNCFYAKPPPLLISKGFGGAIFSWSTLCIQDTRTLVNSTRLKPSREARIYPATQENTLWSPKFRHRVHRTQPEVLILSQMDPVHTPILFRLKLILILSSHLRLRYQLVSFV
jgi:hypothetical protein